MQWKDGLSASLVAWATLGYVAIDAAHKQDVFLRRNKEIRYDVTNQTTSQRPGEKYVITLRTVARWRVVVIIDFIPDPDLGGTAENCAYIPDYLLVGNDVTATGQETLTSYKFCKQTLHSEIVSRDKHLWIVLETSLRFPRLLRFRAKALPQVVCGEGEMQCSPVQCVARSLVCDGTLDCDNGQDEYCYHLDTPVSGSSPAQEAALLPQEGRTRPETVTLPLPPEGSTCFLCRDGTCVLPRAPRYDLRHDVWLWFLCDGVDHCPDGWDEQTYMCYLRRHVPEKSHLFQCSAHGPPTQVERQVRMWTLARCDARRDCRGEGEEGPHRCDLSLSAKDTEMNSQLHADPLVLGLVLSFLVVVVVSAVVVFTRMDGGRLRRMDAGRQIEETEDTEELQSCLATKPTETQQASITVETRHFDLLRETVV